MSYMRKYCVLQLCLGCVAMPVGFLSQMFGEHSVWSKKVEVVTQNCTDCAVKIASASADSELDAIKRAKQVVKSDFTSGEAEAHFRRFDQDGNGYMSMQEFSNFFIEVVQRTTEHSDSSVDTPSKRSGTLLEESMRIMGIVDPVQDYFESLSLRQWCTLLFFTFMVLSFILLAFLGPFKPGKDKRLEKNVIADQIEAGANFNENRNTCLRFPEVAQTTLDTYATLQLNIPKARNLKAVNTRFCRSGSDPYVSVYLDDVLLQQSQRKNGTVMPEWNWSINIPINNARSVVQLRIMDYNMGKNDEMLGFVEFPIAELPIGSSVDGWFQVIPEHRMQGYANTRVKKLLRTAEKFDCGEILLGIKLDIVSGDSTDAWYASCLPLPAFKELHGKADESQPMDAQSLYDAVMLLIGALNNGFVSPLLSNIAYLIGWREKLYTSMVFTLIAFTCMFPVYFLPCFSAWVAFMLIVLKNPNRRRSVVSEPDIVPLNDKGFEQIAQQMDIGKMADYLTRVVGSMQGTVVDGRRLNSFASAAFLNYWPVTTFDDLKRQLRAASQEKKPFVSIPTAVIAKDTLVTFPSKNGIQQTGKIVECVDPKKEPEDREYMVLDANGKTEKIYGDQLQTRLSLAWLSGTILNIIPQEYQNIVNDLIPPVKDAAEQIRDLAESLHAVVAWESKIVSGGITACALFICLSLLYIIYVPGFSFLWDFLLSLIKIILLLIVIFIFSSNSAWFQRVMTRIRISYENTVQRSPRSWTTFTSVSGLEDSIQEPNPKNES